MLLAAVPSARAQTTGALVVSLNAQSFGPGETLVLTAKLSPLTTPAVVDAYVFVRIPTGQYLSLQLGGALVPGIVPIARGFVPFAYEAPLVQYTFSGGEPMGEYTWYAGLTKPATLEFVTPPQQLAFALERSTPRTTLTELSRILAVGNVAAARDLLGVALGDAVSLLTMSERQDVAHALSSCAIVKSTRVYRICATADNGFRFVLIRDEGRTWRVFMW